MALFEELQKTTEHLSKHRQPHHADAPILRADNLSLQYQSGYAIDDISFELHTGERLAVVGPNGAGKSTLLKIIAGVLTPTTGQVQIFGNAPSRHICIAYVPQRNQIDWHFPVTVADVVMMGRVGQLGLFRNPKASDWELVNGALEIVRMTHLAKRQISQLSGGQQQRMFIARALAQRAELMLMDEPLTGLDVNSQEEVFNILGKLQQQGVTVVVTLHDLQMAAERFDRVMLLNHQMISLGTPESVLNPGNLLAAYGGHLHLIPTEDGALALGDTCCGEE
ncbi:MAG TPA: manganese ABC transporter ATP-binding protein [Chloroflexi bacterium]|nr:manganese ABC transporter ATP-binding protein [Chloroflexota bacterium]